MTCRAEMCSDHGRFFARSEGIALGGVKILRRPEARDLGRTEGVAAWRGPTGDQRCRGTGTKNKIKGLSVAHRLNDTAYDGYVHLLECASTKFE